VRLLRRFAILFAVMFVALLVFGLSPRFLAAPFAIALVIAGAVWIFTGYWRALALTSVVFLVVSLSPVDVRAENWSGAPRLMPIVMGYPTADAMHAAMRGEVWLGGCIVSGSEPKWMLVW
jgi:hypothetical protein